LNKIRVDIIGLSSSPSVGGAYALLLKESYGSRRLPIIIGSFEAQAIASSLEKITPPRPMTHDLLKSIIDELGASVVEVFIDELVENTFYAKLVLEIAGVTTSVDARPSDAIAIAVRTKADIYVNEVVMDSAGFIPTSESILSGSGESLSEDETQEISSSASFEAKLSYLEKQLKDAIDKEDYERAAKLRDQIAKLSGKTN
jgi:bifunctional DNase/RNase